MQADPSLVTLQAGHRRPQSFNASVHGARGLFATLVFCFHVANSGLPNFWADDAWPAAWLFQSLKFGVELFFGISGFVIIGALARAPSIRAFLWDRATRIYPLLWLTLIAITLVALATGRWMPPFGDWLLNFLAPPPLVALPQVNPAAWSLGYEISFYALCAAGWAARTRGWRWMPAAVVAGAIAIIFFPRAILMPVGLVLAAGWLARSRLQRLADVSPVLWLVLFLALWRWLDRSAPDHDIAMLTPAHMPLSAWLAYLPVMLLAGMCGTLALGGIVAERGSFAQVLRTPLFRWLGTISYSFYLWHPVVMATVKALLIRSGLVDTLGAASQLAFALIAFPPALGIAHVSQRLVEVRLTRWLRRHGPREDRGAAPITALERARP
ncbi:acyltransferase family protein [Sphingomonas jinjuensis]|uniref:acyltransferase family protein n=1 Tax=Sphingomonas jinjuensis TaxID=535907 RepID=UPI001C86599B|nr:acyltransferase [Sphingomonas jinjuensis]